MAHAHGPMAFDSLLLSAQQLCILGRRNLLIASPDTVYTERELVKINTNVFQLLDSEFKHVICDSKTSILFWDSLLGRSCGKFVSGAGPTRTVLVIRGLEKTSTKCQVALLEILRAIEKCLKRSDLFMVIAVIENIEGSELCLYKYLQEKFWFRQPHLIDYNRENTVFSDMESTSSSLSMLLEPTLLESLLSQKDAVGSVKMVPEIRRYALDIVIFLRNHRIVTNGIPTRFIDEFELLVKCLAVVNNYPFVTPLMVQLAARKFFPLKINICDYHAEPTLNWGSDVRLVKSMMDRWNADLVVEDVLANVRAPV